MYIVAIPLTQINSYCRTCKAYSVFLLQFVSSQQQGNQSQTLNVKLAIIIFHLCHTKLSSAVLTLHPALSEESITLALQRLSHRQNTTKTGQPVIAKAPFEPGKTSEHSRNPKEQTDHINEIGPDIHDQFVPTGGSHSYPSSPTYGGAVYSQGNPHLWSHIQTHNQAIQQLNSYSQVPHCGSKSLEP